MNPARRLLCDAATLITLCSFLSFFSLQSYSVRAVFFYFYFNFNFNFSFFFSIFFRHFFSKAFNMFYIIELILSLYLIILAMSSGTWAVIKTYHSFWKAMETRLL